MKNRTQIGFKDFIVRYGYSKRVADEVTKWYAVKESRFDISMHRSVEQEEFSKEVAAYYDLIPEA